MRLASPLALLLLLLLPLAAAIGWPSRGFGRRREVVSLSLRLVILLSVILSLAGLQTSRSSNNLAVVFVVDVSDSMPEEARNAAWRYVQEALQAMGADDRAAVIVFGGEALVERGMSASKELPPFTSRPSTNQSDLAEAIRLALALYPPDAARRMVILSDGAATTGDALSAARLAAAAGVEIVVVPFVVEGGREAQITAVEAPSHARQGETITLKVSVYANQATSAVLRAFAGPDMLYEQTHQLKRGLQTFSLSLTAQSIGFLDYRVQIEPVGDTHYQNNEMAAFTLVRGAPRVLVIAPPGGEVMGYGGQLRPDEVSALLNVLQAADILVETATPPGLPSELPALAQYAALVLVDVPARQLSQKQMQAIQTYVRELGGGLVTIGGPTAYGVGGYFRTPLEETLPIEMQIKDEQKRPALAMVYIIDHSGSMAEVSGGVPKVELAKEAAIRSIELLAPMDRVGVIAFDDSASWVVEMTDLSDPQAVAAAIGTIRADGGTDILAGVLAMSSVLPYEDAAVKHVILLTDGGADPTGISELVERLYTQYGITFSAVGVGRDAAPFLPELAEVGGGRYHFTADPASIPSIFTEETTLVMRSYLVEETFYPQQVSASPILAGIESTPPLYGYVGSEAKSAAQVILTSHRDDPILAAWQYGLGRAVAFTSDASGRWAKDWVSWQGFATFWAQAVRYSIGDTLQSALAFDVEQQGETARLKVDAQALSGEFLNGYTMQANIVAPDGSATLVELRQTAPGRYEGDFIPSQQGAYLIRLSGEAPGEETASVAETSGWVLSYSPEYRNLTSDPDALVRLAAGVNGRIAPEQSSAAFEHSLPAPRAARPLWPMLLALAALLLPFDIAVRRLAVTRDDLRRAWAAIRARLPRSAAAPQPAAVRSEGVSALLRAKGRARDSMAAPPSRSAAVSPSPEESRSVPRVAPPPTPARGHAPDAPPSASKKPSSEAPLETTSRLLARKRTMRQGQKEADREK